MSLPLNTAYYIPVTANYTYVKITTNYFLYTIDLSSKMISDPIFKSHILTTNNITVYGINGSDFEVDVSGAGSVNLSGEVDRFRADLSGAGSINAKELKAKDVRVSVSGAASADVYAKDYLDASVSGVGSISYYGDPAKTKTDVSGVGSISRK